jgi:hypothetical protein
MPVQISDGGATPHATDYSDLLDKLVTFATANGWTQLENTADKVVLQGEGAGTDEIIVAIQEYASGWNLNGYTGYTNGLTFFNQPGAIPLSVTDPCSPSMPLWGSAIPYWFVVSGRRIIVVAKVGTTFQMCYLGWYLPFASPNQYPYPMFVGGSCGGNAGVYTGTTALNSAFWRGQVAGQLQSHVTVLPGGAQVSPANLWAPASNLADTFSGMFPYNTSPAGANGIGQHSDAIDGSKVLTPVTISIDSVTHIGLLGDLDGVYHVPSGSAEDVITIGADDYLVVQNVFRSAGTELAAIKLV